MKIAKVSIIIVNWNGGDVFKKCLQSIRKLKYQNYELIVVDNASTDGSYKYVDQSRGEMLIVNNGNLGFAPANNIGYKRAKGKYVLLLNNDTTVKSDLLNILVNKMESDLNIGVIQPKIYLMDTNKKLDNCGSFLTRIGFLQHWGFFKKDSVEFSKEKIIFSAKGACMMTRKSIIDKVGLFDDTFGSYFEETDYCWKVWLLGNKVLYFPNTFIYHKLAYSAKRMNPFSVNYHSFKNRISSLIKNLSFLNLLIILFMHLLVLNFLVVYYLFKFKLKEIVVIYKSIGWNILNIGEILKKRSIVQKFRKVDDDQIFKYCMERINVGSYLDSLTRLNKDFMN